MMKRLQVTAMASDNVTLVSAPYTTAVARNPAGCTVTVSR